MRVKINEVGLQATKQIRYHVFCMFMNFWLLLVYQLLMTFIIMLMVDIC